MGARSLLLDLPQVKGFLWEDSMKFKTLLAGLLSGVTLMATAASAADLAARSFAAAHTAPGIT